MGGAAVLWAKLPPLFTPAEPLTPQPLTIEIVQAVPPAPVPQHQPEVSTRPPDVVKKPPPVRQNPLPKKALKPKPVKKPKVRPLEPTLKPTPDIHPVDPAPPVQAKQVPRPKPSTKPAPSPAATQAAMQAEKQNYRSALRAAILAQQKYPRQAQRRRMEGTVNVGFTLDKTGQISNIHLIQGSGHRLLDKAATEAVKKVGQFKPIPERYRKSRWEFEIPVVFRLR